MKAQAIRAVLAIFAAVMMVPAAPAFADTAVPGFDAVTVLTPGLSRTIYFNLGGPVAQNIRDTHSVLVLAVGTSTVTVSVAAHTYIGDGAEMLFGTAGIVASPDAGDPEQMLPVGYAYSSSPLSLSFPVNTAGVAVLYTAVLAGFGNPDFPVTMSMILSML